MVRRVLLIGSKNRSNAPVNAATASGILARTDCANGCSRPKNKGNRPGPTHKTTVTPNAMIALRSPGFQGPRAALRSTIICSAPGISLTPPVFPVQFRYTKTMPISTREIGTAIIIHSTKVIRTSNCSLSIPIAIKFGGVPTGVAIPPREQP